MGNTYMPTTERVRYCATSGGAWLAFQSKSFDHWLASIQSAAFEKGSQAGFQQCDDEWRDRKRIREAKNPYTETSAE